MKLKQLFIVSSALLVTACGGGGGGGDAVVNTDPVDQFFLTQDDVKTVIAQGVAQAEAQSLAATIAVTDRGGNVLAVYRMDGANQTPQLNSNPNGLPADGGLDGLILPAGGDALAAIAKAVTGAYLASSGNAFSTRTAGQIIQEHFNPLELNQAAGPLFGVQFSQLPCSDLSGRFTDAQQGLGPQRSPLGLSADPGGFPLYKNGQAVGGVGVIADGVYGVDKDISNIDFDVDEVIATAASIGFQAPNSIRANRITVDGKTLRFSDVDNGAVTISPQTPADFDALSDGSLIAVTGYNTAAIISGKEFGTPASGVRADTGLFVEEDGFILVDASNQNRYPPIAGAASADPGFTPLSQTEVATILEEAIKIANRARAQIRQPLNSQARVTMSVVDTFGNIVGLVQTRDAPQFGVEVSLQKARTAAFFSATSAHEFYDNAVLPPVIYLNPDLSVKRSEDLSHYLDDVRTFIGDPQALANGIAFSDRAGGNLSRPYFPDGINFSANGPFGKPIAEWSPFSTGQQLDIVHNAILQHVLFALGAIPNDVGQQCTGVNLAAVLAGDLPNINIHPDKRIANGIQIFPGSVPIYRGNTLVGGIGVSGDGIDQDDMISFLGVHNAGQILGTINNAPAAIRADNLTPQGTRLRYVQCPFTPFLGSDEQRVCEGL